MNCLASLSISVKEGDTNGPEIDVVAISKPTNSMLDLSISVDDVCKKLKQLKHDKISRPRGIQSMILKKMAEIVALPLKLILIGPLLLSNKLLLERKMSTSAQSLRKGVKVNWITTGRCPLLQYNAKLWSL